jgi:plasmid stabilization system protein ParE
MSRRLIVRPEAEGDITEAALWYDGREAGLGVELTIEVHAAIRRAVENPLLYLLLRKHPEVRRVLSRRFPYRIFFIVRDDAIVVFAVIHAARHDQHWRERLRACSQY